MDESWSWDGSLVSLHSSMAASTSPSSPLGDPGTRAPSPRQDSIALPPPAAIRSDTAPYRTSYRIHTPPAINTRPPSPVSNESSLAAPLDLHSSSSHHPLGPARTYSHPLASLLLSDLSPPASPAPSSASFPRSGSRSRLASSNAGSAARPGRGRTRTRRRNSASSTASNDGSAHGDEESGTSSAEDNHAQAGQGLVMPSLTLDSGTRRRGDKGSRGSSERGDENHSGPQVNLLLMGKTTEERRTLAALLANDQDLERQRSTSSVDLSYSFVSSARSQHTRSSSEASEDFTGSDSRFVSCGTCGPGTTLFQPTSDEDGSKGLLAMLRTPLEQLEAKLERTFPSTESLASLVALSGVGPFDACVFLFSSPPLACEVALSRSVSQILPILPVLLLPPSPTSKPQKTSALSHAVVQQLDSAGVRWVPIESLDDRRESRAPPRHSSGKPADICGGSISMLPHDLFVQHPPSQSFRAYSNRELASTPTTSFPSPNSEPTSLTSSQELPPFSPTFTTASSSYRSSSSRGSSTRSLSPSSTTGRNTANLHHLTLLDLHRLRRILHSSSSPNKVRRVRAETFLEWREVEVAARGVEPVPIESMPKEWDEKAVVVDEDTGRYGRRGLDFSKRVAERRKALGCASIGEVRAESGLDEEVSEDDGDVLDMRDEEDEEKGGRRSMSTSQDPTTPKPCFRHLPPSSSLAPILTPTPASSDSSSSSPTSSDKSTSSAPWNLSNRSPSPSYFPPFPAAPLSASIVSLPSTSSSALSESSSNNSSMLLLRTYDPFHFPSLLHLVGLNLRLALSRPSVSPEGSQSVDLSGEEETPVRNSSKKLNSSFGASKGWWRTIAMFSVVFAAGVVAGIQVVDQIERAGG
ncbi:hypothetical protein JCM16303_005957 [Sporobolomyces ruberrimus]